MPTTAVSDRVEPVDLAAVLEAAQRLRASRDAREIDEAIRSAGGPVRQLRIGRQLVPFAVIAVAWVAGMLGWLAPGLWPVLAGAGLAVPAGGWLLGARRRIDPSRLYDARVRRRHLAAAVLAGQAWLWWAVQTSPVGLRAVALWVGGYAIAAPYWRRHRIPVPIDAPPPPAVAPIARVIETEPDVARLWTARVACQGGALPGSRLTDHHDDGRFARWTILLAPGRQTTSTAIAVAAMVASALGRSLSDVAIDRHPSGDLSRAVLLVSASNDNPLALAVHHPGPGDIYDPKTGYAQIGIHPDGEPARWAFFVPGWGLAGGGVIGGIGSGKSTLMTNLASTAAYTGILSVWAGDPQGGQSMPAVIRHATWPATTLEEILRQLRAAAATIDIRGALNGLREHDLHIPTAAEPGILLFLDEIHKIFKDAPPKIRDEAVALATLIAREGRKAAVAIVGADQYPGLETFGNQEAMRSSLFARNIAVLRTASNIAKGLVPGLDVNPRDLPVKFVDGSPTSGLGYLVGERAVPFRGFFTPNAAELLAAAPKVELDRVAAEYIGEDYTGREARRLANRAAQAERIARLDPTALERILAADPALADALTRLQNQPARRTPWNPGGITTTPAGPQRRPGVPHAHVTALDLDPWPSITPARRTEPPTGPGRPTSPARLRVAATPDEPRSLMTAAGRAIHDLIGAGVTRTGDLVAQTSYGETHVRNTLRALATDGLIHKTGHGLWAPAA